MTNPITNSDTTTICLGVATFVGCCILKVCDVANKRYPGAPGLYFNNLAHKVTYALHEAPKEYIKNRFAAVIGGAP